MPLVWQPVVGQKQWEVREYPRFVFEEIDDEVEQPLWQPSSEQDDPEADEDDDEGRNA